ncbi:MAG: 5-oxoprolinase subunit PxpB [Chloroflexi bacterium]|nr:5-oxoprolinase subunit PxpB [Chloroflexota bacterium]
MGDAAVLVELGNVLDAALNARVHALARRVETLRGVTAVVPGYTTLLVEYDPALCENDALRYEIERVLSADDATVKKETRVIEIPVRYGGKFGPDLEFVARHNGITTDEVIRIHTHETYQVFMLGFAPGFPYLGVVDSRIAAPRLETPRQRVPAGSVGIAGRQTGIYPRESPGGWRLIARTDVKLFDPTQEPPTLLRAGDRVRFVVVDS